MHSNSQKFSQYRDIHGAPVPIYSGDQIAEMRESCQKAALILDEITPFVKPGVSTAELDKRIDQMMRDQGGVPATLNYRGYPASSCISINHVVNHGIPSDNKVIKEKDILNIDVTINYNGWFGDSSRMFFGDGTGRAAGQKARRLVECVYKSMIAGIEAIEPGKPMSAIAKAMVKVVNEYRFSMVEDFIGHGVGRVFHDAPAVYNFFVDRYSMPLEPGMIFTVEPMVNTGRKDCLILQDGWTAITRDRSLSAQFEHSIVVTEAGCDILTLSPSGFTMPPYYEA